MVLVVQDHATVDELAGRARAWRVAAGQVEPGGLSVGGHMVGVGDEIVTCRNDRRLRTTTGGWVTNGDRWTVTARTADGGLAVASLTGKGNTLLRCEYVAEHVALGYAVTAHKAQGVTVDDAVMIVDRVTCAEQLYVGMTRGRHANHALVICEPDHDHGRRVDIHPLEVLARALARSGLEQSATETLADRLARGEDLALLYPLLAQACDYIDREAGRDRQLELDAHRSAAMSYRQAEHDVRQADERRDQATEQHDQLTAELEQARAERRQAETKKHWWSRPDPVRLSQLDTRIQMLTAVVQRASDEIDGAQRQLKHHRQRRTDLAEPHRQYEEINCHQERRKQWLKAHPTEVAWADDLVRRTKARVHELGVDAVNHRPDHLIRILDQSLQIEPDKASGARSPPTSRPTENAGTSNPTNFSSTTVIAVSKPDTGTKCAKSPPPTGATSPANSSWRPIRDNTTATSSISGGKTAAEIAASACNRQPSRV
jgi:hypothetical protein